MFDICPPGATASAESASGGEGGLLFLLMLVSIF